MPISRYIEKLNGPEHYWELEGYDVRLAVSKINDFYETFNDASLSILYANKDEHENSAGIELNLIRRIHTRHAIIDLNNSFDLLLQIPWFYYRMWQEFNTGGTLYTPDDKRYKNTTDIIRNTEGWVYAVEQNCSYGKVIKFLNSALGKKHKLISFKKSIKQFNRDFIFNTNKDFTIRDLANRIKHNHSLKLKEFYSPMNFNVTIGEEQINLKRNQIGLKLETEFYNLNNPEQGIGTLKVNYRDDLYIDIEYTNGEQFFAKDYIKQKEMYSLDSIYNEMLNYRNAIIDLYEGLFEILEPNLPSNPYIKKPVINTSSINIDSYFKR